MNRNILMHKWIPDLSSSGQSITPEWTKIIVNDLCVINSLEAIEWQNPVQIEICEFCGIFGCNSNGYVWISKIKNVVIFSEPSVTEISYKISSSIINNTRIFFTQKEWNDYFEHLNNIIKFNDLQNAKLWNIYSFILLNSPIIGLQNINKINDVIIDQIVFVDNLDKDLFIQYINEFKNIQEYENEINQNEIYQLTNEYVEVSVFLNNGDEWRNFHTKNNELFYNIGNDCLWKLYCALLSTHFLKQFKVDHAACSARSTTWKDRYISSGVK